MIPFMTDWFLAMTVMVLIVLIGIILILVWLSDRDEDLYKCKCSNKPLYKKTGYL